MSNYLNNTQKEMLVAFIRERPHMETKKFTPTFTKQTGIQLWKELAEQLNVVPNGANKDWRKWRKTWTDLKKLAKMKCAKAKIYDTGTGGGPPLISKLTNLENEIIEIISPVCMGDPNIPEPFIADPEPSPVPFIEDFQDDHQYCFDADPHEQMEFDADGPQNLDKNENTPINQLNNIGSTSFYTITETIDDQPDTQPSAATPLTPKAATPKTKTNGFRETKTNGFRVTKTMRLSESIKNNKKFLQMSEQTLNYQKEYHAEKLKILKEYYSKKEKRDERKTVALETLSKSITLIAHSILELI